MAALFLLLFTPAFQTPNWEEIQKNVLESRSAIHSGEIEILEKKKSRTDSKKPFEESSFTWKIIRSGEKVRGEYRMHNGTMAGVRQIAVVNGDTDGWAFAQTALPNVIAYFRPVKSVPGIQGKEGMMLFAADFRTLGTLPREVTEMLGKDLCCLLTQYHIERFSHSIKDVSKGDQKIYRFSGTCQPGTPLNFVAFEVLPQQGWTFSNIRIWRKDFENRLEIQNQKVDGIWFPRTMKFQQYDDGDLMTEEEVTIQVKSLNKAIPNEIFLIKSLKLKDPTFVSLTDGGLRVWTKERFVTYDEYRAIAQPPKGIP